MSENQNLTKNNIIRQAETGFQNLDPSPFSPKAFELLKDQIGEYVYDLIGESIKISKRLGSDMVSPAHVERANQYLSSTTGRRVYKHLGMIGGILIGTTLSTTMQMTTTGQYSGLSTLLTIVLGMVGAFLIALHFAKD